MNPTTSPMTLYANVISNTLDLHDLAGLFGGTPDTDETATQSQQTQAGEEDNDGHVLTDRTLKLRPLIRLFNGAVQYRAQTVK